jgi:hypothetical protein
MIPVSQSTGPGPPITANTEEIFPNALHRATQVVTTIFPIC